MLGAWLKYSTLAFCGPLMVKQSLHTCSREEGTTMCAGGWGYAQCLGRGCRALNTAGAKKLACCHPAPWLILMAP